MNHGYFVYILSNNTRSTLYIGLTNDLRRRLYEHRHEALPGFANRYHCIHLMYFECFSDVQAAIAREKQLKGWTRVKKDKLITARNRHWDDLAAELFD